jgi:restriction endonuclease S subunit
MNKSQKNDAALLQSSTLPEGWHKVRFGDVTKKISKIVDQRNCDLDRFVAGGHMQTDDFRIKEWGTIDEGYLGPAFNHKFTKGQILYGSRRTYLRKVSIPHFDGVCANTTFVIEPTGNDLIPELLPFVMQSAGFNDHSIRMSKGSTNPYINWKDIACYEFAIPEKEQQRRIATTLWVAEDCIVKGERFVVTAERGKQLLMRELFRKGIGNTEFTEVKGFGKVPKGWEVVPFQNLYAQPSIIGLFKGAEFIGRGFKLVKMTEFFKGDILGSECADRMEVSENEQKKYSLKSDDLLFGRRSLNIEGAGKCVLVPKIKETLIFESSIIRTTLNQKIASPYFYLSYFNGWGRSQIKRIIRSVAASGITSTDLASLLVPKPPLPEQRQIASILTRCDETIAAARANVGAAKALKMKMINEMISPT